MLQKNLGFRVFTKGLMAFPWKKYGWVFEDQSYNGQTGQLFAKIGWTANEIKIPLKTGVRVSVDPLWTGYSDNSLVIFNSNDKCINYLSGGNSRPRVFTVQSDAAYMKITTRTRLIEFFNCWYTDSPTVYLVKNGIPNVENIMDQGG